MLFFVLAISFTTYSQAPNINYKGPFTITTGGTYRGNWQSLSSGTAAITISTTAPVIIENSIIRSAGVLIKSTVYGSNITIRNTSGYGLVPTNDSAYRGEFLFVENFKNLVIENNYLESTSGMDLRFYKGNGATSETVKVKFNKVKNIDGSRVVGEREFVQFVQLNDVKDVPGIEIAWNEIINEPGNSAVEDIINIYWSSGTSSSPIRIHNNFIHGAFPQNLNATGYSGGGIMLADGGPTTVTSFVHAHDNQVIGTTNYGLSIQSGNNNAIYNNRILSSGYTSSGNYLPAQNVGISVYNSDNSPASLFFNNRAFNNVVGWIRQGQDYPSGRNDWWFGTNACTNCTGNTNIHGPITYQMELVEYSTWTQKLKANNKHVGI